eukprot:CAMPEP_0178410944 /NCGR_PEP_ID=MMETSP0689_2-20121128/21243_1 /TAXON_ID=160604 /ORGANISM="Amphidinium massartii, Strain CS-259" /LENGTH=390 /DNA_ID=CAMNT_0020032141 /DNA_START=46 /DNA_END=1218 /DNA_ORIENTATION=-
MTRSGFGVAMLAPIGWLGYWASGSGSKGAAFVELSSAGAVRCPAGKPACTGLTGSVERPAAASMTGQQGSWLLPGLSAAAALAAVVRSKVVMRGKGKPIATSGIRVRAPKNNALRNSSIATFEELTTRERYEPLVNMYRRRFARPKGKPLRMATRTARQSGHVKGTHARMYRTIDFNRTKRGMFAEIETVEYDPYRNARICLVRYEDGERRYILHAAGMFVGQQIIAADDAMAFVGNAMPLGNVPLGTMVHNVELKENSGGRLCKAAGTAAIVLSKDENFVTLKLPSNEVRLFERAAYCTIGRVGRIEHSLIKLGKAGKRRHLGFTPHVRGSAKNACDHPHGGGEGKSPIGHKHPKTPFGKCALGLKTRKVNKHSADLTLIWRKKKSGRA